MSWSHQSSLRTLSSTSGTSSTTTRTFTFARSHSQPTAISSLASTSLVQTSNQSGPTPPEKHLNAVSARTRTQSSSSSSPPPTPISSTVPRPLSSTSRFKSSTSLRKLSSNRTVKHQTSAPLPGTRNAECRANSLFSRDISTASNILSFYDGFGPPDQTDFATSMASNDSKYKSYVTAIDKALKSFEYTSEWADLVSALSKLQRVLMSNSRYKYIPRRFIVGQRLAQCMHPLLPSGVHLKALETYDVIFEAIGQERLLAELTIYSNGLFPLLTNAAINVRPAILELYERRLLPLSDRLKPALDGFLIGVLPCYEEGSDIFKRTDQLLMKVGSGVGMAYFYDSLWRCILHNSSIRLPAINFVIGHFNKKRALAEQVHILGLCMQTVVRAICASLLDSKILVQRAILDLLITCFPLHLNLSNEMEQAMASPAHADSHINGSALNLASGDSSSGPSSLNLNHTSKPDFVPASSGSRSTEPNASPVTGPKQQPPTSLPLHSTGSGTTGSSIPRQHFKRSELVAIITAALTVLLRRDLSLNRRLQNWFFGSDASSGTSGNSSSNDVRKSSSTSVYTSKSASNSVSSSTTSSSYTSSSGGNTVTDCHSSQTAKQSSGSSSNARKSKRIVYFENYARSLVIEAFKRCITNPVSAITSILPATAITNSFITFTMPLTSTTGGPHAHHPTAGHPLQSAIASAGSSPSTSTNSLFGSGSGLNRTNSTIHHHQRTRHVIASSFSHSSIAGVESYSSTNSTFWPYRLLICILDQRDIATPILETLCVDILRGLYHEFELLTTVIPPPSAVIPDSVSAPGAHPLNTSDDILAGYPVSSSTTESEAETSTSESESEQSESPSDDEDCPANDSSSSLSTSIAAAVGSSSALMTSEGSCTDSDDEAENDLLDRPVRRPKSSSSAVKSASRSHGKTRPNTGGNARKPPVSHSRKLSGSSNSSKRMAISASAPTVASVEVHQPENVLTSQSIIAGASGIGETSNQSTGVSKENSITSAVAGIGSSLNGVNATEPVSFEGPNSSELDDSGEDSKKNHSNVFSNFSKNVKTKSATMIRKLQRPFDGGSSNRSSTELPSGSAQPESKMKTAFKTLPLVKQLKHQLDKSKTKKRLAKTRLTASMTPNLMTGSEQKGSSGAFSHAAATATQVPRITIFEDENCFQLPHQHYYWNQYYQQLDKFQRRELLKELDRVMHLLITNVGVEFIWTKLAQIFQAATEEAVSLKKLLRIIIKDVENCDFSFGFDGSEEDDSLRSYEDDCDHGEDDSIGEHASDCSDSDDPDFEPDLDTDDQESTSCSSSLSWARSLASSLLTEFIHDYQDQHRSCRGKNIKQQRSSSNHSSSSSPIYFNHQKIRPDSPAFSHRARQPCSSVNVSGLPGTSTLKHKLLSGLSDRCRNCHATLPFLSPVQPVGSDSLTVLEACTLVRFLLGDSRPYHQTNLFSNSLEEDQFAGSIAGSSSFFSSSNISNTLMTNSVSASMNRCSALEPLAVETSNYHFLIQFLDQALKLMSGSAKSFTPIDLRASVELCLALCAKLKPAIMQTFVLRYRHTLNDYLRNNASGQDGDGSTSAATHRRKTSIGSWFAGSGVERTGSRKTRSSSTASSKKQLELVKEEDEDRDDPSPPPTSSKDMQEDDPLVDDVDGQMRLTDINDDIKMELVVDGVLNFFVVFVESILVRSDRSDGARKSQNNGFNNIDLPPNALRLLQFYRDSVCAYQDDPYGSSFANYFHQSLPKADSINIRHQLMPIYEQLCELLVEIGTVPLLTSPAFLLKRRSLPASKSDYAPLSAAHAQFANLFSNFSTETGNSLNTKNVSLTQLSNSNVRWFIYLVVLSANRLSSCSHMHQPLRKTNTKSVITSPMLSCCALRHIAYTSLGTVLDLLTICRAYLGAQHSAASAMANAAASTGLSHTADLEMQDLGTHAPVFPDQLLSALSGSPSYSDMSNVDLFPGTLTARKLNFFPLIHPDLLDHLYRETVWFKMIAVRLWSNLSVSDSALHYCTIAMLQQLHSISSDTSICEAVLCDEMTGGEHYRGLIEEKWSPELPAGYYREVRKFQLNKLYSARSRFQLLFKVIHDIRFISERLALIVTGLASTAKIDPELESDDHGSDQYDPLSGSTLTAVSGTALASGVQASADGAKATSGTNTLRASNQKLFLTNGLDSFSAEIVAALDPTNFAELDRILRLTCPISPVALCTTLKRHFDRPLFIMLDALAQRRTLSEHASSAADWLLRCLSPFDPFGGRNLPLPTSPLLASYYLGASSAGTDSSTSLDGTQDGFLFGGFGANTDIGRLLEPLLFILLHPNTSRLSVQNANIQRYTRHLTGPKLPVDASLTPNSSFDRLMDRMQDGLPSGQLDSPVLSETVNESLETDTVDESKIYAISSTNGNVIYHVRAKPPLKSCSGSSQQLSSTQRDISPTSRRSASPNVTLMTNYSGGRSPSGSAVNSTKVYSELVEISRLGDLPASVEQHRRSYNSESMKLVVNPFDNLQNKTLPGHVEDVFHSVSTRPYLMSSAMTLTEPENVIQTVVKQVVSELVSSVEEKNHDESVVEPSQKSKTHTITTSTPTFANSRQIFPGMASATKSSSPTNVSGSAAATSSPTRIHISHLHLHLLLYERQYDSARTIYALDTILNMIETWPNRMLYSMATSTFGECNSPTAPGGHLDGTRSSQIQSLYMKHRNSIQGRGFHYQPPPPSSDSASGRASSFKSSSHHKRTASSDEPARGSPSILHNISLLELVVQICLQNLRSYYPSCPSGTSPEKNAKSAPSVTGLDQLFHNLKANQSSCIDLESIYGNQRVRLMACEILRIIFHHLSSMMDQSNSSLFGSSSSSSGRFFSTGSSSRSKGDFLPNWASHLRPFAQYLHDMLLRCEVQRNVLQCLVTSVWQYQQKHQPKPSPKSESENVKSSNFKGTSSYLYPTIKTSQPVDPAANAFINEILEFNDYPARIVQKSLDVTTGSSADCRQDLQISEENDIGFHDEFEKCLLRLLEQVMILENRVAGTTGSLSLSGSTGNADSSSGLYPLFKLQRFHMDLTELRFDPNVCLAGQPLLHGAIQLALQQNYRRHIHSTWLTFVESSLPYAGRFLSRLVLCVLNQLCRNLDSAIEEIERSSVSKGNSTAQPPFTSNHMIVTLQSITMLLSHCLLDRSQLEPLLPFLHDMFEDSDEEVLKTFGLAVQFGRRKRRTGRFDQEANGVDLPANANGVSNGPIQIISSIFHNLMVVPSISSSGTNGGSTVSGSGGNQDAVFGSQQEFSDSPAVLEARKSILGVLNRVIVSLFNVWCTMVVVGEDLDESSDGSTIEDSMKNLGLCAHYYMQFPRHNANLMMNSNNVTSSFTCDREFVSAIGAKRNRFKHSSCSSGWQTTAYTGWYIMGTAAEVKKTIMILLSIVSASHGPSLMASLAQVWSDLRENPNRRTVLGQNIATPTFNYLNGAIDLVIAPVSNQQRQLIQLLRSLSPILSLETLIQTIRTTMKSFASTSSFSTPPASSSSSSFYMMEVALLEIFLAYIRSYPGNTLLNSWRCIMALVKDAHALNAQANIPLSVFQTASNPTSSASNTVCINVQSLVNFHLLAILHEFLFYAPLCEDRRAQKEMQDVANKLIESLIAVAGSRLSHSRWTLRRNLEVLPIPGNTNNTNAPSNTASPTDLTVSLTAPRGSPISNRNSTSYRTDVDSSTETEAEPTVALKRGFFRSSGSVSFPERQQQRTSTGHNLDTQSDIIQMSTASNHIDQSPVIATSTTSTFFSASTSSDSLFSGLFSFGFPNGITGGVSSSSSSADLVSSSQLMFDNFFCVKALYALSEFAAPVLDVVYPSDEKEKMIPLIVNLMSYVVPYLRAHMPHNWPCFDACSRLLASLTDYQYTRKAWRRETLDLLLDGAFFQMPGECMPAWRTIVDRVMTHDKNTFREFLGRMSVAQSPSSALKIFVASSTIRDQEAELKGQLVKRLAFILFCSEKDQYQRYMSEIQEKLIEIHRTSQSPLVQAQVLLAFRVIILRMSPHHLASLWPFIYTEMFQVFLNIENALLEYIKNTDQRFVNLKESESKPSVTSTLSEILNTFSASATPVPTPTQPDSLLSFVETCSAASNLDSLSVGGSRSGTLKFKPVPPNQTGTGKKSSAQQAATFAAQAAVQRYEPIISAAQLQLFLNACKLLDLALILPSDTLPIFQLHRWSFVGDAISFHNSNASGAVFDLGTLFSASASSASMVSDINATPVSGRHQMEATDTIDGQPSSIHSSHSATNLDSASDSATITTFDSVSLNSGVSGHESMNSVQPSSLPPLPSTGAGNRPYPSFIPHIVFLNSILNYLSHNPAKMSQYTSASPILTISSIESIHDLHGFFQALLARSSRSPSTAMITPSDAAPTSLAAQFQTVPPAVTSKQTTPMMFKRNPKRTSKGSRAFDKRVAKRNGKDVLNSATGQTQFVPVAPAVVATSANNEFCSLDDLFINIDRIIANDFLEPLPSETALN